MANITHTTLILFGISGDLSKRKILPSLISLFEKNSLPQQFHLVGITRQDLSLDEIFKNLEKDFDIESLNRFKKLSEVIKMDVENIEDFKMLEAKLAIIDKGVGDRVFYLSVPPETLSLLIKPLGKMEGGYAKKKLIIEKPFGADFRSAANLIEETAQYFKDDEVYHVDHYLAKDVVHDIIKWRETSRDLERYLEDKVIKKVEILSLESIGVEGRIQFYDATGALRDLIQSHLLEVLATLISRPYGTRGEALKMLTADVSTARRGQYKSYRDEVKRMESVTETFAEATFYSTDKNWEYIPFTLITGKAIDKKLFQINLLFEDGAITFEQHIDAQNISTIMDHEKILSDAFVGDRKLFLGNEEILATWKLIDPIIKKWSAQSEDLFIYDKGSSLEIIRNLF